MKLDSLLVFPIVVTLAWAGMAAGAVAAFLGWDGGRPDVPAVRPAYELRAPPADSADDEPDAGVPLALLDREGLGR